MRLLFQQTLLILEEWVGRRTLEKNVPKYEPAEFNTIIIFFYIGRYHSNIILWYITELAVIVCGNFLFRETFDATFDFPFECFGTGETFQFS